MLQIEYVYCICFVYVNLCKSMRTVFCNIYFGVEDVADAVCVKLSGHSSCVVMCDLL